VATVKSALDKGLLTVDHIDTAVRHTLTIRCRLGQFDTDGGPYAKISPAVLNSSAHQKLNRKTADEAMVLLRNAIGIFRDRFRPFFVDELRSLSRPTCAAAIKAAARRVRCAAIPALPKCAYGVKMASS
jgi:hypothetical protein